MTLLKTLKLLAQFLFSNFNAGSRYFDSFVFAKSNLRLNRYFSFEFESLSFFELLYVNFRTIHREDLSLINSLCVYFRKQDIDSILIQAFNTKTGFENSPRHFTLTEPWYVNFLNYFLKSFIQCNRYAICFHFNLKYTEVLLYFFPSCFHFMLSPPNFTILKILKPIAIKQLSRFQYSCP
ncbi:hypothetical protein D3C80_1293450 [compost metagenome]